VTDQFMTKNYFDVGSPIMDIDPAEDGMNISFTARNNTRAAI